MEKNTFPVSAYIAAPLNRVEDYLQDLKNLDEWTLFSRMREKVDDHTWLGSASAYQTSLYYHIRRSSGRPFRGFEWHCGVRRDEYYQVYPTYLFPTDYIEPGSEEPGTYFHWVSFIDPARCTPMLAQALDPIHLSECRALKSVLEHRAGLTQPAAGRYSIKTASIYVDAPLDLGASYLGDARNTEVWTHRLRPRGEVSLEGGDFVDQYGRTARVALKTHPQAGYFIVEHDVLYPDHGVIQRAPMLLFPCSYVFANPEARGFILHRITFFRNGAPAPCERASIADFHAENINAKRLIEASAGNLGSFARGPSYLSG